MALDGIKWYWMVKDGTTKDAATSGMLRQLRDAATRTEAFYFKKHNMKHHVLPRIHCISLYFLKKHEYSSPHATKHIVFIPIWYELNNI